MTLHTRVDTSGPDSEQILGIIEQVWQAFLSAEEGELVVVDEPSDELSVTGCVTIGGAWTGAVVLEVSAELAATAASRLFGIEIGQLAPDEVVDAVGELVNVVGGNIKSMLDGAEQLSIPTVTMGTGHPLHLPTARLSSRVCLTWLDQPLVISVLRTGAVEKRA